MADALPKYGDMLRGVGAQLADRKMLIIKRTFLISAPLLLTVFALAIGAPLLEATDDSQKELFTRMLERPEFLPIAIAWIVFVFTYTFVMRVIYSLEKLIWIDAHFDGRPLTSAQSWRVARRLAIPHFFMRCAVLFLYVVLPITLLIASCVGFYRVVGIDELVVLLAGVFLPMAYIPPIAFIVIYFVWHFFFAALPLRLSGFLFLDEYGDNFSITGYIASLNGLARAKRGGALKRVLAADFGVGSFNVLIGMTTNMLRAGAKAALPPAAAPGGHFIVVFGQSTTREILAFAKLAAYYMVYRALQKDRTGKEQHVNTYVYNLAQ